MIFSKIFRRGNKEQEAQPTAPAKVNPLDEPYEQPASGVDPMAEKLPADPNNVRPDPGPGEEVRLPVDPTRPH